MWQLNLDHKNCSIRTLYHCTSVPQMLQFNINTTQYHLLLYVNNFSALTMQVWHQERHPSCKIPIIPKGSFKSQGQLFEVEQKLVKQKLKLHNDDDDGYSYTTDKTCGTVVNTIRLHVSSAIKRVNCISSSGLSLTSVPHCLYRSWHLHTMSLHFNANNVSCDKAICPLLMAFGWRHTVLPPIKCVLSSEVHIYYMLCQHGDHT